MTSTQRAVSHGDQAPAKRPARKRPDGEGLIRQRKPGQWEARLMVGVKPDGKPDVRSIYGKTQEEALGKLRALRRSHEQGTVTAATVERQTVAAYLAKWLAAIKSTVRAGTWQRYDEVVRLHLAPTLGRHRLQLLRPDHIQACYGAKLEAGLAPGSVRKLHAVLHRALHDAVRWGYTPRNVADAVDAPAVPRLELHPPSAADLGALLATAAEAGDPFRGLWAVAIYSGCRLGELLGLTWPDLDLDAGTLMVRRTLLAVKATVPAFGEPKTARSRRIVTLPAPAVAALRDQRQRQLAARLRVGPDYAPYDLVFASGIGTPLMQRNVQRAFKLALGRAKLPVATRFHDLRNAAATMLLHAGVHPKVVSERLGHSTVTLTLDTYSHVVPGLDADAAARLERVMRAAQ